MHRIAEEGIAAHWKYKEGRKGPAVDDQRIARLRHLVEWQARRAGPGRIHVHPQSGHQLYPEGGLHLHAAGKGVIVLPAAATPIDFAYAIHSDVGNTCAGAKVNGRIVPLRSSLRNGDIVEIMTQPGHQPSKDWLAFVKTSRARNKIKHLINASERIKAIEIGQKYLEKEARRLGVQLNKIGRARLKLDKVAGEYGYSKAEDLHAALGYGRYSARQVLSKLAPGTVKDEPGDEPARPQPLNLPAERGAVPANAAPAPLQPGRPERYGRRDSRARRGRVAGLPRQVMQSHSRRIDRRVRDAR